MQLLEEEEECAADHAMLQSGTAATTTNAGCSSTTNRMKLLKISCVIFIITGIIILVTKAGKSSQDTPEEAVFKSSNHSEHTQQLKELLGELYEDYHRNDLLTNAGDALEEKYKLTLLSLLHPQAEHKALHALQVVVSLYPEILLAEPLPPTDYNASKYDLNNYKADGDSSDKKALLCVQMPSHHIRFGNLLFIYAAAFSIAKDTHRSLLVSNDLKQIKDVFHPLDFATAPPQSLNYPTLSLKHYATFVEPPDISKHDDICIKGFFQSWKFFERHKEEIRKQFQFHKDILSIAQNFNSRISAKAAKKYGIEAEQVTLIGIHMRHSDMSNTYLQAWGYTLPSNDYFYKAMLYYLAKYHYVHFIIATDSPVWVEKEFADLSEFITLTKQPRFEVDLAILSECEHMITSAGTFSWWAGWLNKGQVLYFNEPVRTNSNLENGFKREDFFPPHWLPLS